MHAIPGGFINLITTEIYSRSGSGERRGRRSANVRERPGQDLAKNRDPVQNLSRKSNSNFLTFRSELFSPIPPLKCIPFPKIGCARTLGWKKDERRK
jgi:hypothetical protein